MSNKQTTGEPLPERWRCWWPHEVLIRLVQTLDYVGKNVRVVLYCLMVDVVHLLGTLSTHLQV